MREALKARIVACIDADGTGDVVFALDLDSFSCACPLVVAESADEESWVAAEGIDEESEVAWEGWPSLRPYQSQSAAITGRVR